MRAPLIIALTLAGFAAAPRAEAHPGHRGEYRPVRVYSPRYRVRVAPPAIRAEYRYRAPSHRHVWVPGYWGWQRRHHVWVAGRWAMPPRPHCYWVGPRWVSVRGRWALYPGYWQDGDRYEGQSEPYGEDAPRYDDGQYQEQGPY